MHLYNPENRPELEPTWGMENPEGRWQRYSCGEIMRREGANLALSWIRDKSLEDPDVIADEIADDLQTALKQFAAIATELRERAEGSP